MHEPVVSGTSVPRVDGVAKVTGRAMYTADLTVPGMTHGAVVRSERAHARIISIDVTAAEAVTGVLAVVTAETVAPINPRFGHISRDHPALAVDRVLYYGEPVDDLSGSADYKRHLTGVLVRRALTALAEGGDA